MTTAALRLTATVFGSSFACTGEQVAAVLQEIQAWRADLTWFVADVRPIIGAGVGASSTPDRLGSTADCIQWALAVSQFESGVLAAIPNSEFPSFREGGLFTDDPEDADLGAAIVEVRAVDTTWIGVISADQQLLSRLGRAFAI